TTLGLESLVGVQKFSLTKTAPQCEKEGYLPKAKSMCQRCSKFTEGKYCEALGKWESALLLMPDRAILHEQKAQILLELGETWKALKAATRATELEPSWGEAWVTLGRAQLNYGEPDSAIESLDRALAIKPDYDEARNDRQAALHHIQKRKQLQTSGLSMNQNRFVVVDKTESA
ncbi:hypothetical protein HAX54_002074, partial [Datura stramonium]|nr:hypothetical protein [Datura stramonium]